MLINPQTYKRGDTLIEVLFATAVFSLVAVGALSIMNQGAATSQRALEITLVRQEMDAQAEALRFLNASYVAAYQPGATDYSGSLANEWFLIKQQAKANKDAGIGATPLDTCNPPENSFIINTHTAKFVLPTLHDKPVAAKTFSQVNYVFNANPSPGTYSYSSAEGIWIEAINSNTVSGNSQGNAGFIDFHIRACWDSPGQSEPVTLGTIVRLYEPR